MADVPYCSPKQFEESNDGWNVDTSDIASPELNDILLRASQIVDDYTGTTWGYSVVYDEVHKWKGFQKEIILRRSPIRIITNFRVLVGTSILFPNSLTTGFATIPTTPTGPNWLSAGELPTQFGYVILDRQKDTLRISMTNFNTRLIGLPWVQGLPSPGILISYTAGYDPGVDVNGNPLLAPDGYSLPYPTWLVAATRIIAGAIIGRRNLNAQGLANVQQVRQGDSEFRLYPRGQYPGNSLRDAASALIPPEAMVYLDRRHRTVLV